MDAGRAVIAVGDVHGRLDLLKDLLEGVRSEHGRADVVLLGDYVDRGPDSAGVVDLLLSGVRGLRLVPLRGNHDDMMVAALRAPSSRIAKEWYRRGGHATLESYGCDAAAPDLRLVPRAHVDFLAGLPLWADDGARLFVHAGVRPGVALDRQSPHDLLWIREDFLGCADDFGRLVVHGHSPVADGPEVRRNRINVDTEAYATGRLTAAVFEPGSPAPTFVSTGADPALRPVR